MKAISVCLVMIMLSLTGCSSNSNITTAEEAFSSLFLDISWNNEITMRWEEQNPNNATTNNKNIYFDINNNSTGKFSYNAVTGGSIYYFDKDQRKWIEVKDLMIYHNNEDFIIEPLSTEHGGLGFINYTPGIPDLSSNIELRFIVVGELTESSGKEKLVGAYTDIKIFP